VSELRGGVERALERLGLAADAPAYDGWLDPAALRAAAAGPGDLLLRAGGELAEEGGYAAVPADPVWLVIGQGKGMRAAPLVLAGAGDAEIRREEAAAVVLSVEVIACCDQPKCRDEKRIARLWIDTAAGGRLAIAERVEPDGLPLLAEALAERLGVSVEQRGVALEQRGVRRERPAEAGAAAGAPLTAAALARWALRREGELFVVRDHASHGPREAAALELAGAAVMLAGGVGAFIAAAAAWSAGDYETLTITCVVAVVLTLAAWATLNIGLHSRRYRAASEALLCAGSDRLVVAPWHSRSGAVGVKPEGRYGAALKLAELERLEVVAEPDGYTLRAHSSHGPFDIGTLESADQAALWSRVLGALTARVAHGASLALALLLWLGCTPAVAPPPPATDPPPAAEPEPAAAKPAPDPPIVIIEDDVPRALAEAKAAGKVVFVEVWAPWCHTCLSMKSYVLPDAAIRPLAKRVVFAAIDGDRPENAAFMLAHAVGVWPTLFVIDPRDGTVLGLWQGAASVKELRDFITGAVDVRDADLDPAGPLAAMLAAKRAEARGALADAAVQYERAIERGGAGWARRSEALIGLLFTLARQKDWERCAKLGAERVAEVQGAAVPTDFASILLGCAAKVEDEALAALARERAIARLERHTAAPPADASVDDRSDALAYYADALKERGDAEGARAARLRQVALLEEAAAKAPGVSEASTFDYARMGAYLALGQGDKAVALLSQRTRELPDSYEPFARLAQALMELGRFAEARAPMAAAIERSYGPRKLRYLASQATLFDKLGEPVNERAALEALIAAYDALPEGQRQERRNADVADKARARLAELDAASAKAPRKRHP
jgi:thiol-disulfide isomerase/thioredoxin